MKATTEYINKKKRMMSNLIYGRKYWSPSCQSLLNQWGNQSIISQIEINRAEISSNTVNALNMASFGDFKENMDNENIQVLYHLSLYLHTNNGIFKVDKESTPNICKTARKPIQKNESRTIACPQPISINLFLENAIKKAGTNAFFTYSAKDANCQHWVLNLLQANGIQADTSFIKQNTDKLFGKTNYLRKLSNTVTDLANRADVLVEGEGVLIGGKYIRMYRNGKK